jgi:hypothetical protein
MQSIEGGDKMPQLDIYFFGLICHIGQTSDRAVKSFAAVLRDGQHDPFITNGTNRFAITSNVTFSGKADATAQSDFLDLVPSLKTVFDHDLDPAASATETFTVDYPGGDLTVASIYPCQVSHIEDVSGGTAKRVDKCVARLVKVSAQVAANAVFTFAGGSFPPITGATEILVANVARMPGSPKPCKKGQLGHGHINAFHRILKNETGKTKKKVRVEQNGQSCTPINGVPPWIEDEIRRVRVDTNDAHDHAHKGDAKGLDTMDFVTLTSVHEECGNTDLP